MDEAQPVITQEGLYTNGWNDEIHGEVYWRTLFSAGRSPTKNLTAGMAEIPPGREFKAHRHKQTEIYHITGGNGEITIDGFVQKVAPGCAVYIPGNAVHCLKNTGTEPLRFFYTFAADSIEEVKYHFIAEHDAGEAL
ncbi:cupin domain-containing protein [Balneolales bacterium ANBcel1]|nr:cupin domain-containing protein [Balneolales bacterium ANBcel1]